MINQFKKITLIVLCCIISFLFISLDARAGNLTVSSTTGISDNTGEWLERGDIVRIYKVVGDKDNYPIVDDELLTENIIGDGIPVFQDADGKFTASPVELGAGDEVYMRAFDASSVESASYYCDSDTYTHTGVLNDAFDVGTHSTTLRIPGDPPLISSISDTTALVSSSQNIPFTISDSSGDSLTVTVSSSNTSVVPNLYTNLSIVSSGMTYTTTGTGSDQSLTLAVLAQTTGSSTITLTVTDIDGQSNSSSFTITVLENVSPEIADIANQTTNEDTALESFSFTVSDANGGDVYLTISSSNLTIVSGENINITSNQTIESSGGSYTVTLAGTTAQLFLSLTPTSNMNGQLTITVSASDGASLTSKNFLLTVNSVNDSPTITSINNQNTQEETAIHGVNFTVTDIDYDNIKITAQSSNINLIALENISFTSVKTISSENNEYTVNMAGASSAEVYLSITPTTNITGISMITITVNDGSSSSNTSFTITVTNVNDAPTISSITNQTISEDNSVQALSFTVSDIDNDELKLSASSSMLTLVAINNISFTSNQTLTDQDNNYTVTLSSNTATMYLYVTPAANISGSATITITVNDSEATTNTTFLLTVNPVDDPPTVSSIDNQTTNEDTAINSISFTVTDIDSDSLKITANSSSLTLISIENMSFSSTNISDSNNEYTVTLTNNQASVNMSINPDSDLSGAASITVTVSDSTSSIYTVFQLTVNSMPDSPTISSISNQTTNEDVTISSISFKITDVDGGQLRINAQSSNTGLIAVEDISFTSLNYTSEGSYYTVTLSNTNAEVFMKITPTANQSGSSIITITVSDLNNTAQSQFTLNIDSVNDTPVISNISNQTCDEDNTIKSVSFAITDVDNTSLKITIASSNTSLISQENINFTSTSFTSASNEYTISNVDPAENVYMSLTPAANISGTASITLTVTDNDKSITTSFILTVNSIDDPPELSDIASQTINEDNTASGISFRITDVDGGDLYIHADSSNETLLAVNMINFTSNSVTSNNQYYTVSLSNNTAEVFISLTPTTNESGTGMVTVTVTDQTYTITKAFSLTVNPVNDSPSITEITTKQTNEDSTISGISFTISDVDSSPLTISVASSYTALISNSEISITSTQDIESIDNAYEVTLVNNSANMFLQITPTADQSGSANITITVTDGGQITSSTFSLTVTPVNDSPIISSISDQTTDEDTAKSSIDFTVTDVDGGDLLVTAESSSATLVSDISFQGTNITSNSDNSCTVTILNINAAMSVSITPAVNQSGNASITITVNDGQASSYTVFNFSVTATPDNPTISTIDNNEIDEDNIVQGISFNIADPDGGKLTLTAQSTNTNLIALDNISFTCSTGIIKDTNNYEVNLVDTSASIGMVITPATNMSGSATITVLVSDGTNSASEPFVLTVNSVNDFPEISSISNQNTNEDTTITSISFTLTDVDVDDLLITAQSSVVTLVNSDSFGLTSNNVISKNSNSYTVIMTDSNAIVNMSITPLENMNGDTTITVSVSDQYTTIYTSFVLGVSPVNDSPTATTIVNQNINEDNNLSDVMFSVGDVDGDNLTIKASSNSTTLVTLENIVFSGTNINKAGNSYNVVLVNNTANINLSITPTADQFGNVTITVDVGDGNITETRSFNLSVISVNDAPEITEIDQQNISEDSVARAISFTVSDIDDSNLIISASSSSISLVAIDNISFTCASGFVKTDNNYAITLTQNTNNMFISITPTADQYGDVTITISAFDGDITSTVDFGLHITNVNDSPEISLISNQTSNEDIMAGPISFSITDIDNNNNNITIKAESSATTIIANENISFSSTNNYTVDNNIYSFTLNNNTSDIFISLTPSANESGLVTITINASDSSLTATTSFVLTINAVNDPPSIGEISDQSIKESVATEPVSFTISDIDSSQLMVTAQSSNTTLVALSNMSITSSSIEGDINEYTVTISQNKAALFLTLTPTTEQSGNSYITITVSDGNLNASSSFQVRVSDAPTISSITDQNVNEDNSVTISLTVEDDDGDSLEISIISSNQSLVSQDNISLTSATLISSSETGYSVSMDGTSAIIYISVTPTANEFGYLTFTVNASDKSLTGTSSFGLTINSINDTPLISSIDDQTINEDEQSNSIAFTVTDIDSSYLTIKASSSNLTLIAIESINFTCTGNISNQNNSYSVTMTQTTKSIYLKITPDTNQFGTSEITIQAGDGNLTATTSFAITVNSVNDAPVLSNITTNAINEDTSYISVPFTLTDVDNNSISISFNSNNLDLIPINNIGITGTDNINNNGGSYTLTKSAAASAMNLVITPAADQNGLAFITIISTDGTLTASTSFTLTVNPVNDSPLISDIDNITIDEDTSSNSIAVTATDIDNEDVIISAQSSNLTLLSNSNILITGDNSTALTNNDYSVTVNNSTSVVYLKLTPTENEYGSVTITVSVTDKSLTLTKEFVATVSPVNDSPQISEVSGLTIQEDSLLKSIAFSLTDIDNNNLNIEIISSDNSIVALDNISITSTDNFISNGNSSTITKSELSSLMYVSITPTANAYGNLTITISVTDGALTATSIVNLTVNPVNDPPDITDISDISINEDAVSNSISFTISDIDNNELEITADSSNSNLISINNIVFSSSNSMTINTNTYDVKLLDNMALVNICITPTKDSSGTSSITVNVNDGTASISKSFTITVNPVNDGPAISIISDKTTYEDIALNSISFTVSDIDTNTLIVTTSSSNLTLISIENIDITTDTDTLEEQALSSKYTLTMSQTSDMFLTITPVLNQSGVSNLAISIFDGEYTATTQMSITVVSVNDIPYFTEGNNIVVDEDSGTQIQNWATNISQGAENESDQSLNFQISIDNLDLFTTNPTMSISQTTGILTFTPKSNYFGNAEVTVILKDNGGTDNGGVDTSISQSFYITVNAVNDAPSFVIGDDQNIEGNTGKPQTISNWAQNISAGPSNESAQNLTFYAIPANYSLFESGPFISNTGTLSYTPYSDVYGSVDVNVYLSDGASENYTSGIQTFSIFIESVNNPPSFTKGNNITVNEDIGITTINNWAADISAGSTNEKNQVLTFDVNVSNPGLFEIEPEIIYTSGTNANLSFKTSLNKNGSSDVYIFLTDSGGIANGGKNSYSQTFTITVNPVNDAPVFTKGSNITVKSGSGVQTIANWATNINSGSANENQTLTFNVTPDNTNIFTQLPSISSTGTLTFTPISNTNTGSAIVSVTLSDDGGTANGGNNTSSVQTFIITVTPPDAPTISDIPDQEIKENESLEAISFIVTNADSVSAVSSNQSLVSDSDINIAGTGNNRTISINPETDAFGALTITVQANNNALSATDTFVLTIYGKPSVEIAIAQDYTNNGTSPMPVQFTPINIENEVTDWYWDFGDGNNSSEMNPVHTFFLNNGQTSSSYSITLTVSGPGGTYSKVENNFITVNKDIYVDFIATSSRKGVAPLTVNFLDISDSLSTVRQWNFGDGNISNDNSESMSHEYTQSGTYTVSLTAGEGQNAVSISKTAYITVEGRIISGKVTASDTSGALNNYNVEIWYNNNELIGTATTNTSGDYTISNLPAVSNLIVAVWPPDESSNYLYQFYSNQSYRDEANRISLLNSDLENIDFSLQRVPTAGITGRILNAENNGMYSVIVDIYSESLEFAKSTVTDENGYYTFTALKSAGDYLVSSWSQYFNTEFYYAEDGSTVFIDKAGFVTPLDIYPSNINIKFEIGRTIKGCVYSEDLTALENIWVNAWSEELDTATGSLTDENGYYTISGLEDSMYIVEIQPVDYPYQAYSLVTNQSLATPVTINSINIDFVLKKGVSISGKVKDTSGKLLSNILVSAWSKSTGNKAEAATNESGVYTILNLPFAADYKIAALPDDYPIMYYNNKSNEQNAAILDLRYGNIQNINFILDKGPVIKGFVYIENDETPAGSGIWVNISSDSSHTGTDIPTDSNGMFEVYGLDQNISDYVISIWNPEYMSAFYNENGTVYNYENAQRVSPSSNSRNIILRTGFNISGTVKASDNGNITKFRIEAWSEEANYWAYTETSGRNSKEINFEIKGLKQGTYELTIYPENYADMSQTIIVNSDIDDISFILDYPSRSISGTVKGLVSGKPVTISAWSSTFDKIITVQGNGDTIYNISGLKPASDYIVEVFSSDYPYQVYNNKNKWSDADLVNITSGNAANIDFNLSTGQGNISGTITFPDNAGPGDKVYVEAFSESNTHRKGIYVTYLGIKSVNYSISNLLNSKYIVSVWPHSNYNVQYYNNTTSRSKATIIDVSDGIADDSINFILTSGKTIQGTVTDDQNNPQSNIYVEAWSDSKESWSFSSTNASGQFIIDGLVSANDYIVCVRQNNKAPFYYNINNTVRNKNYASFVSSDSSNINIKIYEGYTISGYVRDISGKGLFRIMISIESSSKQFINSLYSEQNGYYEFSGIPLANDYKISVKPSSSLNYIKQEKMNISAESSNIDFILASGFNIQGVVTAESNNIPISKVEIELWSESNNQRKWTKTDQNGKYIISGITEANDYMIIVNPPENTDYQSEIIEDVSINNDTYRNIELRKAYDISGYIYMPDGQTPLSEILVTAFSNEKSFFQKTVSNSEGFYKISNIPDASDYLVIAWPENYAVQKKTNISASSVLNFVMITGGSISGEVTDENGYVNNAIVEITSEMLNYFDTCRTNSYGKYEFTGLKMTTANGQEVNDYIIKVSKNNYPSISKGQKSVGDVVNFKLSRGQKNILSGTVKDSSGTLLPKNGNTKVTVFVYSLNNILLKKAEVKKDGTGSFQINGLSPEKEYKLVFMPTSCTGFNLYELGSMNYTTSNVVNFQFSKGTW